MNDTESRDFLKGILIKFRTARLAEIVLVSLGLGLLVFALARLLVFNLPIAVGAGGLAAGIIFSVRVRRTGAFLWDRVWVALFLNREFPVLEDSADLLVKDKPLTGLEEVQRQHVLTLMSEVKLNVHVPHRIGQGFMIIALGIVAYLFLPAGSVSSDVVMKTSEVVPVEQVKTIPVLTNISVEIVPPGYTRIAMHVSKAPGFSAPANSKLTWRISFQGKAVNPTIIFSAQDTVVLRAEESQYSSERKLGQSTFYQVGWRDDQGKSYLSDFYRIDIRPDLAPGITIVDRVQFQEVRPGDPLRMQVRARISDDYGVADAHLIATVSKGSGESVKFREEKLLFENASRLPGKQVELTREIDLQKLGLEPGDELYFYAEALDNMSPVPNLSRTETFFIALQDTAVIFSVADSGLGVDLMPEYFRSQRQIIIDTEKLLAQQRRIKKVEFNSRSNELGFDQKTLRLRYGQFLGEENEAGIGMEATEVHDDEEEEDPLEKFGHQHDTKNEHNLVPDKTQTDKEEGEDKEDPLKAFMHQHDDQDEATFFIQSVKAKLKAALTLMWDAELHLRMYEPKKSLPFQYKILALLKEISQDSRVYVHRTGFDPPPIKEERRLTGELDEVVNTTERFAAGQEKSFPAIQAALIHVEQLLQQATPLISDSTRILANRAGYEVATVELSKPGSYLQILSGLRKLADGKVPDEQLPMVLLEIRQAFWSILPVETYSPNRGKRTLHFLDKEVLENLEKDSHE